MTKPMTKPITIPITIPRNLKPETKLWYSKTEYATVVVFPFRTTGAASPYDRSGDIWARSNTNNKLYCYREDGCEVDSGTAPIIRIERITSAPAKKSHLQQWTQIIKKTAKPRREVLIPDCTVKPNRAKVSDYERRISSDFKRAPRKLSKHVWFYPDDRGIEFFGEIRYGTRMSWRALETLMKHRAIARRLEGGT